MTSFAPTLLRVLVTLLAIVAAVAQVAYLDALWWQTLGWANPMSAQMNPALLTLIAAHGVVSVVSGALAVALVLHEGARQEAARGLGLALGAWSYLMAYSGVTLLLRPDPGGARTVFEAHFLMVEVAGLAGLLRFTALFPAGRAEAPSPMPPEWPSIFKPLHLATVWMLRPAAPWVAGAVVLALLWGGTAAAGRSLGDAGLNPVMDVVRFGTAGLVVLNLRRSWGRTDAEGAARLAWLLVALVFMLSALMLFVGGNVLVAVTGWPEPTVAWRPLLMDLGLVAFLVGLAMSVLHRGSLDATRLASRVAALSTVATLGLFLAAALEALFSGGMLAGFALRTGLGTIVAFATVVSTHRGLVRALERVFSQIPAPDVIDAAA